MPWALFLSMVMLPACAPVPVKTGWALKGVAVRNTFPDWLRSRIVISKFEDTFPCLANTVQEGREPKK